MTDVIVIGADIAGLTCAQQLQQVGITVLLIEKSRGVGGRAATRRLASTCADHGVRYLELQGDRTEALIQALCETNLFHIWVDRIYQPSANGNRVPTQTGHPRYVASTGITAVAKALATNLDIWRSLKAIVIAPAAQHTSAKIRT